MTTIAKLLVGLGIDAGEYNSGLAASVSETQKFSSSIGSLGKLAAGVAIGAAASLISVATGAGVAFAGFQNQMAEVFTLLPDASGAAMSKMTQQVKAFSLEFGVLPEKTIPALYESISSGIPADNVFAFLTTAQQAAKAGVTDLKITVDGLTSVVNAYGQSNISAAQASDLMFTAVKFGKTTFEQLSTSLYNVTPVAASLGLSFDNITAALASMTLQGVPTATATTQLRQMLIELSDSGTEVAKTFEKVSGQSFRAFIASGGNLQSALQLLEKAAMGGGKGINELFGSVEAGGAALALTGTGTQQFTSAIDAMANSAGSTGAAYKIMNGTIAASAERIKAAGAVFLVTIGEKMAPSIAKLADMFVKLLQSKEATAFIEGFANALAKTLDFVVAFGGSIVTLVKAAFGWGQNIGGSFAKGILAAAKELVGALKTLGSIISNWLKPGSPPKITPDLDKWGSEAGQLYIDSWSNVDYSALSSIGDAIQSTLRGLADVGQFGEEGIIPAVLLGRQGVSQALSEIATLGSVSESTFNNIVASLGPVGGKLSGLMRGYFDLAAATRKVEQAQGELNKVTEEYSGILAPMNAQMKGLQDREQEIRNMQRIEELNKIIADGSTDALDRELAENELAQIAVGEQIAATEEQRDVAVSAAEEKLKAAEKEQAAIEARVQAEQQLIDVGNQTNSLIAEQIGLLQQLAESASASSGGGGGIGGGLGDIGGLGDLSALTLPPIDLSAITAPFTDLNTTVGYTQTKFLEMNGVYTETGVQASIVGGVIDKVNGIFTDAQTAIAPLIPLISGLGASFGAFFILTAVLGPLSPLLLGVVAAVGIFTAAWMSNWGGIQEKFSGVMAAIQPLLDELSINVRAMLQNMQPSIDSLMVTFEKWSPILATAAAVVGTVLVSALGLLGGMLPGLGMIVNGVVSMLTAGLNFIADMIVGFVDIAYKLFTGDFIGALESAKQLAFNLFNDIGQFIGGMVEVVLGFIATLVGGIVGFFTTLYNTIVGNSIVPDLVDDIITTISKLPGEVLKFIGSLVTDAITKFTELKNDATKRWNEIKATITTIVGDMVQAIKDKANDFLNAGKALIQNVIDGIKAMAQSAVDAVNEVLQSARDLLPGSEPRDRSSPLANLGQAGRAFSNNFIGGIILGWNSATPGMIDAILASVEEIGKALADSTPEMIADLKKQFLDFVKDFANASAGIARGVAENFADLYELGKATGPEKALQDANKAFAESKKNLDGITSELAEVQHLIANAEASKPIVFDEESAKRAEEHQRYLNGLYDQQNKLLLDQNEARNQTRYLEVKAQEQGAQTTQQRNAVLAIAEQAKQQYAALTKQVNDLLAAGKAGEAIAIFNEESARIAELADLRQRRALSTDFNEQSFLDMQIRLVEAAQRSEKEAQKVELTVNLYENQTEAERFMELLTAAFEAMGISADILVRSN